MPIAPEKSPKISTGHAADASPASCDNAERARTQRVAQVFAQEMIENLKRNIPENRRLIEAQMEKNRRARESKAPDEAATPVA